MQLAVATATGDRTGAAKAQADIELQRKYIGNHPPLAPVHQLAANTVKSIVGHPELQVVREVMSSNKARLVGRVVARCFSPQADMVPSHMLNLALPELAEAVFSNDWSGLNLTNLADGPGLAANLCGDASRFAKAPDKEAYKCPNQISRLRFIAPRLLELAAVVDDEKDGWRRIDTLVSWLELTLGWAQQGRTERITKAVQTLIVDSLSDAGKRVGLARTSARPDYAPFPIHLMPDGAAPIATFWDFLTALKVTMARERTDAGCGFSDTTCPPVSLPSLCGSKRSVTVEQAEVSTAPTKQAKAEPTEKGANKFLLTNGQLTSEELKYDKSAAHAALISQNVKGVCFPFLCGGDKECKRVCRNQTGHAKRHQVKTPDGFKMSDYIIGAKPKSLA